MDYHFLGTGKLRIPGSDLTGPQLQGSSEIDLNTSRRPEYFGDLPLSQGRELLAKGPQSENSPSVNLSNRRGYTEPVGDRSVELTDGCLDPHGSPLSEESLRRHCGGGVQALGDPEIMQLRALERSYYLQTRRSIIGEGIGGEVTLRAVLPDEVTTEPYSDPKVEDLRAYALSKAVAEITRYVRVADGGHKDIHHRVAVDPMLIDAGLHIVEDSLRVNTKPCFAQLGDGFELCCEVTGMIDLRNRDDESVYWYMNASRPDALRENKTKWVVSESGVVRIGFSIQVPVADFLFQGAPDDYRNETVAQSEIVAQWTPDQDKGQEFSPGNADFGGGDGVSSAVLSPEQPSPPPSRRFTVGWFFLLSREAVQDEFRFAQEVQNGSWSLQEVVSDSTQRRGSFLVYGGVYMDREFLKHHAPRYREDMSSTRLEVFRSDADPENILLKFSGPNRPTSYVPAIWDSSSSALHFVRARGSRMEALSEFSKSRASLGAAGGMA